MKQSFLLRLYCEEIFFGGYIINSKYILKMMSTARKNCAISGVLLAKANRPLSQVYAVLRDNCAHLKKDCFECRFIS